MEYMYEYVQESSAGTKKITSDRHFQDVSGLLTDANSHKDHLK